MQCLFKCMKNVSVQICVEVGGGGGGGGGSEFIGNQVVQLEKLQRFEGVQLSSFSFTPIYIYI